MKFLKSKSIAERAQEQQAKVQFMRAKVEEQKVKGQITAEQEKARNAELRRLRA
jgi:hypothetical protein